MVLRRPGRGLTKLDIVDAEVTFEHVGGVRAEIHGLLEGPTAIGDEIAFSDVFLGGVFAAGPDGRVRSLLERRRGIGGITATADGGLVVTGRDVSVLAPDGTLRTLYADASAKGFNDLAALRDGSLVAGVLRYAPMAGEPPVPGELVRIAPDGTATVIAGDLLWPNGIVELADGALLVSDFARAHVKRIEPDGSASVFAEIEDGSADGLALDADGALWIATGHGGRLRRVLADGTPDGDIDVPAGFVSSVCFAGPTLETLVITTADDPERPELGGSLLTARAPVPGAAVPPATAPPSA